MVTYLHSLTDYQWFRPWSPLGLAPLAPTLCTQKQKVGAYGNFISLLSNAAVVINRVVVQTKVCNTVIYGVNG